MCANTIKSYLRLLPSLDAIIGSIQRLMMQKRLVIPVIPRLMEPITKRKQQYLILLVSYFRSNDWFCYQQPYIRCYHLGGMHSGYTISMWEYDPVSNDYLGKWFNYCFEPVNYQPISGKHAQFFEIICLGWNFKYYSSSLSYK
jgi:hypothetical protein